MQALPRQAPSVPPQPHTAVSAHAPARNQILLRVACNSEHSVCEVSRKVALKSSTGMAAQALHNLLGLQVPDVMSVYHFIVGYHWLPPRCISRLQMYMVDKIVKRVNFN